MGSTKPHVLLAFFLMMSISGMMAQNNLSKAEKQFELGAYNLALETYNDVLKSYNGNLKALVGAGDCYRLLNKMDAARQMYATAIINDEVDPVVYEKLGKVMKGLRQYEEAKMYFKRYEALAQLKDYPYTKSCDFALNVINQQSEFELSLEIDNSPGADFGPAFFKDQLVFSSSRSTGRSGQYRKGSGRGFSQYAKSKMFKGRINSFGNLQGAKTLHAEWDKSMGEGPVSYSESRGLVVITKNNFVDGTRQIPESKAELSLYFAEIDENGNWTKEVPFEHNGPGYSNAYGCFSEDGNMLYFASDRKDNTYGGFDIFVSYFQNGTWTKPVNLGPSVNTQGDEITPFVIGSDLYFSSDYHPGLGGMDVFISKRNSGGLFTDTQNLGKGINSSRDDYGFIYDPFRNVGFLSSNRLGGKGNEDIYSFKKNNDLLMISVFDAISMQPIPDVKIDLSSCGGQVYTSDALGRFSYSLLREGQCNMVVSKSNYESKTISLTNFGSSPTKSVRVELISLNESFEYFVRNKQTGQPVSNAIVTTNSIRTGKAIESVSDAEGRVILPVSKGETFKVTIFAEGFIRTTMDLYIPETADPNYIQGSLYLSNSLPNIKDDIASTPPKSDPGISSYETPSSNERPVFGFGSTPSTVHYVQLAAIIGDEAVDKSTFERKLQSEDMNVVVVFHDGKQKVRVGPYMSKAEASAALGTVKKSGYKGAFVIPVKVDSAEIEEVYAQQIPEEEVTAKGPILSYGSPDNSFNWPPLEDNGAKVKNGQRMEGMIYIQLGAFKENAANFNASGLQKLIGDKDLVKEPRGNLTAVLVGAYKDRSAAEADLRILKKNGYSTAFIKK